MKSDLVRFGVAMEAELLAEFDVLAETRGTTRSELLRDLARREVARAASQARVPAVAAVTLVYNHHVRLLSERLTAIQHELGDAVRSTMHVHLDHDNCLEVIVMRGRSDHLRSAAEHMLGTRGVTHGGLEMVTERALAASRSHRLRAAHEHAHDAAHERARKKASRPSARPARAKRRAPA
jgi:CopG family nickel-responsive transcriptional regulator